MLSCDFATKICQLNRKLRIACGNNSSRPAGLYIIINGEEVNICGIDKNFIPEYIIYDKIGHIVKSGWRRPIQILIGLKLVNKNKAESLFKTKFNKLNTQFIQEISYIQKALKDAEDRKIDGKFRKDDIVDIGRMIKNDRTNNNHRRS